MAPSSEVLEGAVKSLGIPRQPEAHCKEVNMKMNEHNGSHKELREELDKLRANLVKEQARNRDTRPAQALQELIVKALDSIAPPHMSKESRIARL